MKNRAAVSALLVVVVAALCASAAQAVESDASPARGVSVSIYDAGIGLFGESRSVQLAKGENSISFRGLPTRMDPSTAAVLPSGGRKLARVLQQEVRYDLASLGAMYDRYLGNTIRVVGENGALEGILVAAPGAENQGVVGLKAPDGSVSLVPQDMELREVIFPGAAKNAFLEPTMIWHVVADEDGAEAVRLLYTAGGVAWDASYDAILSDAGTEMSLSCRVRIENRSGKDLADSRIRIVETARGDAPELLADDFSGGAAPALRYAYGSAVPRPEASVATPSALRTYELPRTMTVADNGHVYVELHSAPKVPVQRFFVYDGVRFDRFQRNPKNDWNYGTRSRNVVESYLEFHNKESDGLGVDLPRGRLRLYKIGPGGVPELLGDSRIASMARDSLVTVPLGPARGLTGERERTGYTEVMPLHVYEESFEIRLDNASTEEVEVRVVEHLYRWHTYEIVKSDTDYVAGEAQTIEFRPLIKPGGRRSIHYTVRYRW